MNEITQEKPRSQNKVFPMHRKRGARNNDKTVHFEGWAQDYGYSNIFLKPLFRGNLNPFVNNANLGAIAHTSNGT